MTPKASRDTIRPLFPRRAYCMNLPGAYRAFDAERWHADSKVYGASEGENAATMAGETPALPSQATITKGSVRQPGRPLRVALLAPIKWPTRASLRMLFQESL